MLFRPRSRREATGFAPPDIGLAEMRCNLASNGPQLYIGTDGRRLTWAGPQQALLVVGPPRSGKTSCLVVPNVLAAPGPLVVTSTKLDVLHATAASRSELGRCWVLDPTGTVAAPSWAPLIRWSPVASSLSWEEALVTARVMTTAARPEGRHGEGAHWTERAEALLGPMLHAAALKGSGMAEVAGWVLRHDLHTPVAVLGTHGGDALVAMEVLAGIAETEERERSGIFSTAAGALGAYRSARALELAEEVNFDPSKLPTSADTVYVCAPSRYQAQVAPIVVAFLEQVRAAAYTAANRAELALPTTLLLDEVANIAPLPDLPAMVSEGGGQGLLTMACLQDLSQARGRWGPAADGFLSLFGAKVLLPGVGDMRTLEAISGLAGQVDVPVQSVSRSAWWSGHPSASTSYSWRLQPRLPVDQAHSLPPGTALVIAGARPPAPVLLTPWWGFAPFSEARSARPPCSELPASSPLTPVRPPRPGPGRGPSPSLPDGTHGAEVSVTWQGASGPRRLHPPPPRP